MDVRILIDEIACVGYGECVGVEPDAVELDADGVARPLVATLPRERARRLCAACPSGGLARRVDA